MVLHIFSNYSEESLEIQHLLMLCNVFSQETISAKKKKKINQILSMKIRPFEGDKISRNGGIHLIL